MLRGDAQSNGVYLRPESARAIDCKTRGLRWSNRARYPCADPQQRLRETMKFFAIFLTACALSVFAFAAPDAAPDPDSERIAAQGKPLKNAPAHFSARLPKERARRQYEQYGEREATQGKLLKSTLAVERGWARWLPSERPAAAYMILENRGAQSVVQDGKSKMVRVRRLTVPAHGEVGLMPGGYHLMLEQARRKIAPGNTIK